MAKWPPERTDIPHNHDAEAPGSRPHTRKRNVLLLSTLTGTKPVDTAPTTALSDSHEVCGIASLCASGYRPPKRTPCRTTGQTETEHSLWSGTLPSAFRGHRRWNSEDTRRDPTAVPKATDIQSHVWPYATASATRTCLGAQAKESSRRWEASTSQTTNESLNRQRPTPGQHTTVHSTAHHIDARRGKESSRRPRLSPHACEERLLRSGRRRRSTMESGDSGCGSTGEIAKKSPSPQSLQTRASNNHPREPLNNHQREPSNSLVAVLQHEGDALTPHSAITPEHMWLAPPRSSNVAATVTTVVSRGRPLMHPQTALASSLATSHIQRAPTKWEASMAQLSTKDAGFRIQSWCRCTCATQCRHQAQSTLSALPPSTQPIQVIKTTSTPPLDFQADLGSQDITATMSTDSVQKPDPSLNKTEHHMKRTPCSQCHILTPEVTWETCQRQPHGISTAIDTIDECLWRGGRVGGEMGAQLLSPEVAVTEMEEEASPESLWNGSDVASEEGYETPMTSPNHSPMKQNFAQAENWIAQLDGGRTSTDADHIEVMSEGFGGSKPQGRARRTDRESLGSFKEYECDVQPANPYLPDHLGVSRFEHDPVDLTFPNAKEFLATADTAEADTVTPLVPASPAKGASAFPFPKQLKTNAISPTRLSSLRQPSALLSHERSLSARQRRLLTTGASSPDRFIPSRAGTPTKDALYLDTPSEKISSAERKTYRQETNTDPFGPTPRRNSRTAEQYATIRGPSPLPITVGRTLTLVQDARSADPRAASAGTVWTVGGSLVTEGVPSITNGRGGRVTSGTNAPHYTANFLKRTSPNHDQVTHRRRLATAMDINQSAPMIGHCSPYSPQSMSSPESGNSRANRSRRIWRDGNWEMDGSIAQTKRTTKKVKEIPIIPFRVLDAPSLRDDYYCSLLAYSPTVKSLAVGLGPHVYLWTESRGAANIPDSLTAPYGSAHVTSVTFSSREGSSAILAIGRADGHITLWSPLDRDPRFDSEQPAPVSCVCFRPNTVRRPSVRDPVATVATEELLVGDEVGCIYYYSIEWPSKDQRDLFDWHGSMTLLARISCHGQQVCGIAWSPDGEHFATGGNDNKLFLFEGKKILRPSTTRKCSTTSPVHVRNGSSNGSRSTTVHSRGAVLTISPGQEKHVFTLNAAVKAVAFAPWQSSLLAAGGGSNDRCIHFFHALSGANLATIDCHAQVTSLVWSEKRKEIAATFGFAQPEHAYRVAVFSWPRCEMIVAIPWWGEERALYAVAYPRGPSSGGLPPDTPHSGLTASWSRTDAEGRPWYGKRTREEGCLVVATSDASIKFHEIWAEKREGGGKRVPSGVLASSQILEGECSGDVERSYEIR